MARLLRIALRLVALVLLLPGLVALVFFGVVIAAGDGRAGLALGQVWFRHDPFVDVLHTASLPLVGAIVERRISPVLWDPILVTWLNWPSWLSLGLATLLFAGLAGLVYRLSRRLR